MWIGYDKPSKDIAHYTKHILHGMGYTCYISYIGSYIWDMTWLWLGFTGLIFIPGIYYIYTVCNLFRMRYAEYILKLKNLYIFYTTYILTGLVDVLVIYLGYDNIGDILLQNVVPLVYFQVMGYMRTGREFKRIVWICSFFEFPTRLHITYNSWIWLIFGTNRKLSSNCRQLSSMMSYIW